MEPTRGCVLVSVALILLMDSFMEVSAKKGVLNPRVSLKPPLLDPVNYKTTYACEGKTLQINCTDGVIHLIRANYGRFSISICNDHGNLEWRVNCMSYRSFLIMQERCNLQPNCSINVSSSTFQDPCPGTVKYLEVQFHCGSALPSPTMPVSSMHPLLKALPTMNTTLPFHDNKSHIIPPLASTVSSQASTLPTFSPVARHPSTPVVHLFPTAAVFSEKSSTTDNVHQEIKWPMVVTPPPKPSTVGTTMVFSEENYCAPTFARGINWSWTLAGETAVMKCPEGALGFAKWHCKSNAVKWETESPDLKQCRSLWLESIKERMQREVPIIGITTELLQMSVSKLLFGEDLKEIAELIQQVLYKGVNSMENFLDMWHRYNVLRELLQSLVNILSNLLDDKQKPAWNDLLLTEKRAVISSLLEGVEESALLLADTSNEDASFSVVKSNVLLSLQVIKAKTPNREVNSIHFPASTELDSEVDGVYWSTMQDHLQLPAQALQEYFRKGNGLVKLVFTAFNNAEEYLRPGSLILHHPRDHPDDNITRIVNSRIISASLERAENSRLLQPVIITLRHLKEENVTNPVCVFWDFHSREWSARGCQVEANNRTHTVCACDHLTSFAVVMEVKSAVPSAPNVEVLNLIISIGCIVALVCLLITVVVLIVLRNVTGDSATTHRNMFLCLFISELVFVGGINQTGNPIACAVVAGMLQYFFLAAFSWMFFECYQQYVVLIETCDASKVRAWWYYAVAYIAPAIIVGISAVVDPSSYGTHKYCWLQADNYFVFSFVGPAVGIVFGGIVFLCIALFIFCHQSSITTAIKGKEEAKISTLKYCVRRSIFLTLFVSLTWTTGLLYINKETVFLACSFVSLNAMQGIYILILYCLRNEEVKQGLKKILRNQNLLPSCRHPNPKDQEPQVATQLPSSGTTAAAAGEHISQQYWNLMKDRNTHSSPKCITPGPLSTIVISSPEGDAENVVTLNSKSSNKKWDAVTNASWGHRAYSSGDEGTRDDSSSATLPVDYKTSGLHHYNQQYCHFPAGSDPSGQFVDHIYETIDDEPNAVDYQQQAFAPLQQFPPAENYYGDHSDLSQHSSSSYGYDQRPLLIAGPQPRQPSSQQSYCISRDYSGSPSPDGRLPKTDTKYASQSRKYKQHEKVNPERTFSNSQPVYDGGSSDTMSGTQNYSAKDSDPDSWGPSLPDLLQCPVDSAVVLAVLDGEKVVSRLQQEDIQCQPKCKLSTYC